MALMLPLLTWNLGPRVIVRIQNGRGRIIARQAENLRLSGRSDQAMSLLVNAFGKAHREPVVIRGIAWASATSFPSQAQYFLDKLVAMQAASTDDLLLLASMRAAFRDGRGAAAIYQDLVREQPSNPDVWRAWAAACHQCGEFSEAMKAYRRVLLHLPHDIQAAMGVADLLMRTGSDRDRTEAIAMLLSQLERATGARLPESNQIADFLMRVAVTEPRQRSDLARLLPHVADPLPEHQVAAIVLSFSSKPVAGEGRQRRERLRAYLSMHRGLGLADRAKVSSWLHKSGEHALLLDWTSLAEAAADARLFAERLEALMACGLWREAAELAMEPGARDLAAHRDLLQTLAILRSCREPRHVAESMLEQALHKSRRADGSLARNAIGYAALDYGLFHVAANAFAENMADDANASVCPLSEYLLAARNGGHQAGEVEKVLSGRSKIERADLDLQKQAIYFHLLCGSEIERAAWQAGELRKNRAADPYLRFLDAFARYRLGDYLGATQALIPLPSHRWHQGETLVIATILASGGHLREAAALATKVSGKGIFEEERRLLESWQNKTLLAPDLLSAVTDRASHRAAAGASSPRAESWREAR